MQNEKSGSANCRTQNAIEGTGGGQKERRREDVTHEERKEGEEERAGEAGEGGRMLPGHSSRWCLKCSGGLFPLLSLLMSFLCSCVFYTPCDGR